ncbi:hypothetical protein MNAN1_001055 [Malassezia nana]|uniref:Ams2/SPT21 N-terminal domain-containing protein n=1 Tax=Malassezia nana TaxID=180528 RepID=A0AAF0J6I8_9BASI|nr:hypothetical protein MNAN1_001055 [Malassezia nana]
MIARSERRVPVRIARQRGTNRMLGRVSLKLCLNAVCCASPELLLDKSKDYIVYAVDPEESPRPTSALTSPRRASGAHVFVGKGFFSGGLEEPGDGTSHVTGPVRTEVRNSSAFSSDEEDGQGTDVLEIVLQLKEASQKGREQYQNRMRGMASSTALAPSPTPRPAESLSSTGSSPPPLMRPSLVSPPATGHPRAQVLQVLQAMQAHQGSLTSEQQAHLMGLLGMVAGAMQSGTIPTPSEADTSPAQASSKSAQPNDKAVRAHRPGLRDTRTELPRICYNCGTRHATTWRILTLPAGVTIHHPASERPPSDAVPLTWTPQYGDQGPIETHSEARWQACNPCGLYFAKYGVARPDYVRNFVARPGKEDKKRDTQAKAVVPDRPKRAKNAVDTPRSSLSRTLSAVANRDAERLQQRRDENVPPSRSPPPPARPLSCKSPRRMSRPSAFTSPSAGFGISSAMMNSSPNTVLNTLMSEADMDFEERQTIAASPRRPSLLSKPLSSPVRRSPRKQPPGTVADVNPYATAARSASSPMPKKARVDAGIGRDALTSPTRRLQPANPFMGLGMLDEEADVLGGPPSPSAGRTSRAKPAPKREVRTPSRMPGGEAWQPSMPTSAVLGLDEALPLSLGDNPPAMKELFADSAPWMAVWDARQDAPPASAHAHDHASAQPPAETTAATTSQALTEPPVRQPRPATVEDASSTPSGSPVGSPEESLVDLIEDPYGLLSACGLGVLPGAVGEPGDALAVSDRTGMSGFSADAFNGIELHGAPAFAQHLEAFTQSGGLGVAAHVGGAREAGMAALPGPHVKSFGHVAKPPETAGTDLEAFLDDPTVQAMLTNLNEAPSHGGTPLLTS